jgi:putative ABC transport system permease protein
MKLDYFVLAFKNLKKRGIRTWLTMLGIFIGIAAIVSLISLGQGLEAAIVEQFEEMGTDKIMIIPGSLFGGFGTGIEFTIDDMEVIEKTKGVEDVTEMLFKVDQVEFKDSAPYGYIAGLPPEDFEEIWGGMQSVEIDKGRYTKEGDKYHVVMGYRYGLEDDLFEKPVDIGDKVTIQDKEFRVVGLMKTIGNPQDDMNVYVPIEAARELWDEPDKVDYIIAVTKPGEDPSKVAERIEEELRDYRDVEEGAEDFQVSTTEELLGTFGTILTIVQAVLIGVATISLLVGGIGIMNTMYTSVLERTQEIGVMKAIGAKNSDVLSIFLIEAGVLGMVGGIVGILIGIGFSELVSIAAVAATGTTIFQAYFPWYLIVGSLAFSFIVGSVSGLVPAIQASRLKPVDALRYE